MTGPVLTIEEVDADIVDTPTITSSSGVVNFANVRVTGLPSQGLDSVGLNLLPDRAQLLFGSSPLPPTICLDVPRLFLTADCSDLSGFLNLSAGEIGTLFNTKIDTTAITTNGEPIVCDWNLSATDLPGIALVNNPLKSGLNSDGSKGGFQLGEMLIGLGESVGTDALLYFGKGAGSWLMSLGSDALSMFSGYCSLSEAGLSLGADAAGTGAALGGDLAAFEAGSTGLVMASTADEAAALFSSAGVLSELGLGFGEAGEAGIGLLEGIESSTAEFEEVLQTPDLINTIAGSARWIAF